MNVGSASRGPPPNLCVCMRNVAERRSGNETGPVQRTLTDRHLLVLGRRIVEGEQHGSSFVEGGRSSSSIGRPRASHRRTRPACWPKGRSQSPETQSAHEAIKGPDSWPDSTHQRRAQCTAGHACRIRSLPGTATWYLVARPAPLICSQPKVESRLASKALLVCVRKPGHWRKRRRVFGAQWSRRTRMGDDEDSETTGGRQDESSRLEKGARSTQAASESRSAARLGGRRPR